MRRWAVILWLAIAATAWGQGPHELAAKDIVTVRPDSRQFQRYYAMPHVTDKKELEQLWEKAMLFWVPSLSREAEIEPPKRIALNLWRVDLRNQKWTPELWEKLADVEPWYSVRLVAVDAKAVTRTVIIDHKGGDCTDPRNGRVIKDLAPGRYSYEVTDAKGRAKNAAGAWVPAKAFGALATETRSQIPLVRLDWWLAEVTTGNDRGTGYYDWLGLGKKEADFQGLVGADVKKARDLRREIGALVSRSTVTLNNRALDRYDAISGPYWRSRDYARNTDVKNALRLLDGDIEEDASEQYGTLPNRLFAFWLQDGKGNRADAAPDFIAADGRATGVDRRVKVGLSCVRCHTEGIRPINDWARKVYSPPFALEDRLYEETKRKRSKYLSDLQEQVEEDQQRYARVLKKTNGLTPAENAKVVADAWANYVERDRSLADVAVELGVGKEALLAALKAEAKRSQLDPVLAALVQGLDVRIEHLEELVPLLYEILSRGSK